ncbi:hypothetical protein [Lentibacillus sp.]
MGSMCDIVELDEENLTVTTKPGIVHRNWRIILINTVT